MRYAGKNWYKSETFSPWKLLSKVQEQLNHKTHALLSIKALYSTIWEDYLTEAE